MIGAFLFAAMGIALLSVGTAIIVRQWRRTRTWAGMGFILLSVRKAEPTFGSLALGLLGGVLTWAGFVVALPW